MTNQVSQKTAKPSGNDKSAQPQSPKPIYTDWASI